MPDKEQAARMRMLRSVVAEFNAYRWAADMLADAARLRTEDAGLFESRQTAGDVDAEPAWRHLQRTPHPHEETRSIRTLRV
jgi:trehalose-6-phosphate synthase